MGLSVLADFDKYINKPVSFLTKAKRGWGVGISFSKISRIKILMTKISVRMKVNEPRNYIYIYIYIYIYKNDKQQEPALPGRKWLSQLPFQTIFSNSDTYFKL